MIFHQEHQENGSPLFDYTELLIDDEEKLSLSVDEITTLDARNKTVGKTLPELWIEHINALLKLYDQYPNVTIPVSYKDNSQKPAHEFFSIDERNGFGLPENRQTLHHIWERQIDHLREKLARFQF